MSLLPFSDTIVLDGSVNITDRGLVALAKAARTGVQEYLGSEVGRPDMSVVRVNRPASEVFHADALASFSHAPITVDHPPVMVTPDNWDEYAVGEVSTGAEIEKRWVSLPLIVKAKRGLDAYNDGKRGLSGGYTCELDWTPGVTEDGEAFDCSQTKIRINHVAMCDMGRAGPDARIGDDGKQIADKATAKPIWGASPITTGDAPITQADNKEKPMSTVNVVLGDKAVAVAVADAPAVEAFKADAAKKFADAQDAHEKAIAAKDADLAKKDAEIDALKAKVLEGPALDAAVAARGDLIAKARAIAPDVKTDGLSDAAIRKAVVTAKLGDAVKDKAEAYIDARFDILAEDADKVDPVRQHLATQTSDTQAVDSHAAYLARMTGKKGV